MELIEDGYNIYIATFFFISCVAICSYFLLNLTVAVMLEKFKRLKQRSQKKQEDNLNLKFIKDLKRYKDKRELNQIA